MIADPLTTLSLQQTGALAGPDHAGNLGHGILRQFNVTFDYAGGALYLEKNANFGQREACDRAGVWIERGARGFEVVDVVAGGPADAAGVTAGDVIVAIDGQAVASAAARGGARPAQRRAGPQGPAHDRRRRAAGRHAARPRLMPLARRTAGRGATR